MFGKSKKTSPSANTRSSSASKGPVKWDVPVIFGIIFCLSIAELGFTVDSFIYLQRKHKWWSGKERARMGFLIFSSVRTIALAAVYIGFHCAIKYMHASLHTIFLVMSTILWIISGVFMHQMWGYVECANSGVANSVHDLKENIKGGLSECHEIKIIEILAWTIAGISIVATVPITLAALKKRKEQREMKKNGGTRSAV